jgi:hypothetical protein
VVEDEDGSCRGCSRGYMVVHWCAGDGWLCNKGVVADSVVIVDGDVEK